MSSAPLPNPAEEKEIEARKKQDDAVPSKPVARSRNLKSKALPLTGDPPPRNGN